MIKLNNWSIVQTGDIYTPPELFIPRLQGIVYNHPKKVDGTYIRTSKVISIEGRKIITKNNVYQLGSINPDYRKWLRKYCPNWNWRNPFGE